METLLGTQPLPSFRLLFYLLLTGLAILAFFGGFRRYVLPLIRYYRPRQGHLERWLPLFEATIWVAYAMTAGFVLIRPNPLIGTLFATVILIIFWPFLRDFGAGLLIRISNHFARGQKIRTTRYNGTIRDLGRLAIEVETDKGEVVVLPYFGLSREPVTRTSPSSQVKSRAISLPVPAARRPDLAVEKVKKEILSMPWCINTHFPSVEFVKNEKGEPQLQVILYAIDEAHISRMEQLLEQSISQN